MGRKKNIRWKVQGADRESGEARSLLVIGDDEIKARNAAADLGVLVETIECLTQNQPTTVGKRKTPPISKRERDFWSIVKKILLGYGILVSVIVLTFITIIVVGIILLLIAFIVAVSSI